MTTTITTTKILVHTFIERISTSLAYIHIIFCLSTPDISRVLAV